MRAVRAEQSDPGGADEVVGDGAEGITDERNQKRGKHVVPACAGHCARSQEDVGEKEFESNERDMQN